ncbi:hypothetical protein KIPB_014123, partial [Kipferlia bialata]
YLRETPYAPVADRSGTLHRMFLPDHGYIMDAAIAFFTPSDDITPRCVDAAIAFFAHCMRDDPLMQFVVPDRARKCDTSVTLEMITLLATHSAWAAARYGSLWMLVPDGAEVTHFSGGMI